MKKSIAILFLFIYSSTAFGAVVNLHYCGKHLEKISILNFGNRDACSSDPGQKPMGCCKNVTLYFKAANHTSTQTVCTPNITFSFAEPPAFFTICTPVKGNSYSGSIACPRWRCSPETIYLLNRVFRL